MGYERGYCVGPPFPGLVVCGSNAKCVAVGSCRTSFLLFSTRHFSTAVLLPVSPGWLGAVGTIAPGYDDSLQLSDVVLRSTHAETKPFFEREPLVFGCATQLGSADSESLASLRGSGPERGGAKTRDSATERESRKRDNAKVRKKEREERAADCDALNGPNHVFAEGWRRFAVFRRNFSGAAASFRAV